jgi:hypothetical protein
MRRWRFTAEVLPRKVSKPLHDERLLTALGNHVADQTRPETEALGARFLTVEI